MNKLNIKNEDILYDVADLFKVFGDSTRLRILYVLFNGEKSVNDIAISLNMNQSAISHQLRILKDSKLVKKRRAGQTQYYSLDDDHIYNILSQGIEHLKHQIKS